MIRYFAAILASVRAQTPYSSNSNFIDDMPHSAEDWTDEESIDDETRYWSHFYKRDGASTVSVTRRNGEYVVFAVKLDVQLAYEFPSGYDYDSSSTVQQNSRVEPGRDLQYFAAVDPGYADGFNDNSDDELAWPHICMKVPDDAEPGATYWGSVKITEAGSTSESQPAVECATYYDYEREKYYVEGWEHYGSYYYYHEDYDPDCEPTPAVMVTEDGLVRYAAIEVTVADEEVVDYYWYITSELEGQLNNDGKYNTNYIMKDIEPEYSGYADEEDSDVYFYYGEEEGVLCETVWDQEDYDWQMVDPDCVIAYEPAWADAEDWDAPNSQFNTNTDTTVIFYLGEDCDIDLAPTDARGPLNRPGENAIVTHIIEYDQEEPTRDLEGYALRIPADAPAGQSYFLSFTTTADDQYTGAPKHWTVELVNEGPVQYSSDMFLAYKYGVYNNMVETENKHLEHYEDLTQHLARGADVTEYLVREITLKPRGVFEVCAEDAFFATWATAADLPGDLAIIPHSYWLYDESDDELCVAWQVPADAAVGKVFTVGLVADVEGEYDIEEEEYEPDIRYSGHWKIVVGNTPFLAENVKEFEASLPDGDRRFLYSTLGEARDGFTDDLGDAIESPIASLELVSGQGFSTEFAMTGLSGASKLENIQLKDQFDVPLNREKILLTPHSQVAIKATSDQAKLMVGEADPSGWYGPPTFNYLDDWVGLGDSDRAGWSFESTRLVYPCFAWSVPSSATPGDTLFAGVEVLPADSSQPYYGVFEVKVVAPPAAKPAKAPEVEEASLSGVVTAVALIVGVLAASVYLFLI